MSPERIGHYLITSKLGEGGMGAVYRATDPKLNRDVAIKVLPEVLANDPDYLARFGREAQVLASLNHLNIATIYGVEDRALVMELVPGQTLAERIEAGPIPLDEALELGFRIFWREHRQCPSQDLNTSDRVALRRNEATPSWPETARSGHCGPFSNWLRA